MSCSESRSSESITVAGRVAKGFASLPQVEAVALAGSLTSEFSDTDSDVDLYVYVTADIPLAERAAIAAGSSHAEIGNATWEPGDEWVDAATWTRIDVMFRHVRWIEEQLDRVLVQHQASAGYSTCFWHNVLHSKALFDRVGWFAGLQIRAHQAYPNQLRQAIINKNLPLLRRNQSSYLHQIELAVKRNDPVSVNHRVAALLASYFDLLFAVNKLPHPGEKRMLQHAARCPKVPRDMERQVRAALTPVSYGEVVALVNKLLDGLDTFLGEPGVIEVQDD